MIDIDVVCSETKKIIKPSFEEHSEAYYMQYRPLCINFMLIALKKECRDKNVSQEINNLLTELNHTTIEVTRDSLAYIKMLSNRVEDSVGHGRIDINDDELQDLSTMQIALTDDVERMLKELIEQCNKDDFSERFVSNLKELNNEMGLVYKCNREYQNIAKNKPFISSIIRPSIYKEPEVSPEAYIRKKAMETKRALNNRGVTEEDIAYMRKPLESGEVSNENRIKVHDYSPEEKNAILEKHRKISELTAAKKEGKKIKKTPLIIAGVATLAAVIIGTSIYNSNKEHIPDKVESTNGNISAPVYTPQPTHTYDLNLFMSDNDYINQLVCANQNEGIVEQLSLSIQSICSNNDIDLFSLIGKPGNEIDTQDYHEEITSKVLDYLNDNCTYMGMKDSEEQRGVSHLLKGIMETYCKNVYAERASHPNVTGDNINVYVNNAERGFDAYYYYNGEEIDVARWFDDGRAVDKDLSISKDLRNVTLGYLQIEKCLQDPDFQEDSIYFYNMSNSIKSILNCMNERAPQVEIDNEQER